MPRFQTFDGIELSYEIEGEGSTVLLLHGYASDSYINWIRPGLADEIARAGFRAVALDQRGHGMSDKPHDPSAYADEAMVRDAQALLDHLGVETCSVVGYSMGARNALRLIVRDDRVRAAVLGGIGSNMLRPRTWGRVVADAMIAPDPSAITDKFARSFRDFAELTKADRVALAAVMRDDRGPLEGLDTIKIPTLIVCGANDPLAGSPQELADAIPGAKLAIVGGTHLNVVNNTEFRREIIEFLTSHSPAVAEGKT